MQLVQWSAHCWLTLNWTINVNCIWVEYYRTHAQHLFFGSEPLTILSVCFSLLTDEGMDEQ